MGSGWLPHTCLVRILHVVNRLQNAGNGITNVTVDLATQQRSDGHDVHVASAGGDFVSLLAECGVPHHVVDFNSRRPLAIARALRRFRGIISRVDPDIIHVHTITPAVLVRVANFGGRAKSITTVHNEYQRGVFLMGLTDAVVGVSAAVSAAMVSRMVRRERVFTVPNGTLGSFRRPPLRPENVEDLPPNSIVSVGAVSHRKGVDVLIQAFELLVSPDFRAPNFSLLETSIGSPRWRWPPGSRGATKSILSASIHSRSAISTPRLRSRWRRGGNPSAWSLSRLWKREFLSWRAMSMASQKRLHTEMRDYSLNQTTLWISRKSLKLSSETRPSQPNWLQEAARKRRSTPWRGCRTTI